MSESIGNRIKGLREEKDWSQRELAERIGINYSVINRIELDKRPVKDLEISKFADIFSVSTDYLVGKTNKRDGQADQNNLNKQTDLKEKDIEEIIDDPQLGLWFKAGKETTPENRKKALEFLKFIEEQEKDRKPGDKQK